MKVDRVRVGGWNKHLHGIQFGLLYGCVLGCRTAYPLMGHIIIGGTRDDIRPINPIYWIFPISVASWKIYLFNANRFMNSRGWIRWYCIACLFVLRGHQNNILQNNLISRRRFEVYFVYCHELLRYLLIIKKRAALAHWGGILNWKSIRVQQKHCQYCLCQVISRILI